MPQAIADTVKTDTQTCNTCPYFENYHERNGRGWCHLFNHQAREHHALINDCRQNAEQLETQEAAQPEFDSFVEEQAEAIAPESSESFSQSIAVKREKPVRKLQSITLISSSDWRTAKDRAAFRQELWEVVNDQGRTYSLQGIRNGYGGLALTCPCKAAEYGRVCYHAKAVKAADQERVQAENREMSRGAIAQADGTVKIDDGFYRAMGSIRNNAGGRGRF